MTHDDELRRRMNRLADDVDLGTVTLESVEARGRRRTRRQRGVAVVAALTLVVGAAFTLQTLTDRQADTDVAGPGTDQADTSTADAATGDGSTERGADGDETSALEAAYPTVPPAAEATYPTTAPLGGFDYATDDAYYGDGGQVVAWKDGFLTWGQRFTPSDVSFFDIIPDLSDRLPAEVMDALAAAGYDDTLPSTIDEFFGTLEQAGLAGLAEEAVFGDPELAAAFEQASMGGTYTPFVEVSADGVNWTPVDIPFLAGETGWPQVSSNGDALVVAIQSDGWDHETSQPADQTVTIHTTTDLETWHSHTLDIDLEPAQPWMTANIGVSSVAAGPDSWYMAVNIYSWVDVWAALPADLRAEMEAREWWYEPTPDALDIVSYPQEQLPEPPEDATEEEWIEWEEASWQPTVERSIPWSELPFSFEDIYGPGQSETLAYTGDYAGNSGPAGEPPVAADECCNVIPTDAGFVTLVWDFPDYDYEYAFEEDAPVLEEEFAPPTVSLWFSSDGQTWTERSLPDAEWFDNVVAVRGGVLLLASGPGSDGQQMWRGSADGTGWEAIDGPALQNNGYLWFQASGPDGVAAVIDTAEYNYREFVAYSVDFTVDDIDISLSVDEAGVQHLVASRGGDVLVDRTAQLWESEVWQYGDDGQEVVDDDGNVIVTIDWETMETEVYSAESLAWQKAEQADPYVPEFVLIASVDGRTWFQQPLPSEPGVWYEQAVISNGIVTVKSGGTWATYPIG